MSQDHANRALEFTGERYLPEISGEIRLEHLHRYLIARELSHGKRVLDIACGEGYGSAILASVAARVFGVDIAADVIAHASSKYVVPNLEFSAGACEAIPLPDCSVDVVVSFETIEHVQRQEEMLREMRRVLCPGGLLIISSPDRRQYSDVLGNRNQFHVRELDRDEFGQLLRRHFRHVSMGGQRVRAGSIVAPLDGSTSGPFLTFREKDPDAQAVPGLVAPVYLLALASDAPLPSLPIGLTESEDFLWATALTMYYAQVQGHCAVEIGRRLGETVHLDESNPETLQAEFNRQVERVSVMAGEAKARAAVWEADQRKIQRLASDLETAEQRAQSLRAQVSTYERSQSWRLTAPLRAARRRLGRAKGRLRAFVGGGRGTPGKSLQPVATPQPAAQASAPEPGTGQGPESILKVSYQEPTPDYVPLDRAAPAETRIKLLAFYLPQFHPIPENDAWWGKGFTEWTNVVRARPQFEGHYQPHLPGELGFYDLRLIEIQQRQIELAKLYGIYGFCFHHYWFSGRKLLQRPLEQFLAHPELDFHFCLCWANENWTRTWDGLDSEILIGQQHSPEDDLAFIRNIEPALRDPRYIRVAGRPLLMVYRPALLPDPRGTAERWRQYCREAGLGELFLVSTHSFDHQDPRVLGFDAATEFAPNNMAQAAGVPDAPRPDFRGVLYDYRELVRTNLDREVPGYPLFRCVTPMWDNEARRPSRGVVYAHSSPGLYRQWLEGACKWTERHLDIDEPFVFVNAWNEWAEGAHLEPDQRYGYAYLNATAEALARFPPRAGRTSVVVVSHDAYFHGAQVLALNLAKTLASRLNYLVDVVLCGPGPLKSEFEAIATVHDVSPPELTPEARLAVVQRLYDRGARVVICNTSVVGEMAELFKRVGFSVVSLIHELPGLIQAYGLEESIKRIARHSDKVVFGANVVRDKFTEATELPAARGVIQPQGLFAPNEFFGRRETARQELRRHLGLASGTRIVLAVGYADRRKGIDLFVDVGVGVIDKMADVVFVWVGHQEQETFDAARMRVASAGLSDLFIFPGAVRNSDLFLAGADLYLMTSREDPFPNVVIQALDAGLPVIGFEGAGGFVELLQRGCGVLVPFCDAEAMAAAAIRALTSPTETAALAATAREILARDFSFVNYARSLVELVTPGGPKVSVVVPNFNYARYLPERLTSIIRQTYPPHEILFLDDCSSDGSVDIAAEILHGSGLSYRIIPNASNQGTYRQWLRGLREASGDLVWIAEADDVCAADFLAQMVVKFDRPDVILAYCQSRQIDEEGRELAPDYRAYTADISETRWVEDYVRNGLDEIRDTLVVKNTIPNVSAVLMRNTDISAIEPVLLGLRNAGDWLLYVHLLKQGSVAFESDVLNDHRRHANSVTIGRGGLNLMREIVMVQRYILERFEVSADVERKRQSNLQATYEYLGLHNDGPASFKDHEALKVVEWAGIR
jgi:O-antigen biosynthesis protein